MSRVEAFIVDTKGKSLEEVGTFPIITTERAMPEPEPERELTAGELFDGTFRVWGDANMICALMATAVNRSGLLQWKLGYSTKRHSIELKRLA